MHAREVQVSSKGEMRADAKDKVKEAEGKNMETEKEEMEANEQGRTRS